MTKSIILATLLAASLAACAQNPARPPTASDTTANSTVTGFVPYCGPIWLVDKQGYVRIPCPPGSGYEGGLNI